MRVLVCGGRDYSDKAYLFAALDSVDRQRAISFVMEGGARGADQLAAEWAIMRRKARRVFDADWARDGKAAGPIRNQRMLDEGKPDLVIAFPGGGGTADMIRRATRAGVSVRTLSAQLQPHELISTVNEK